MKKAIAILLLLCLVASTFAGCSSPKADDSNTGTTDHTTVEGGTTAPNPDEQAPNDGDDAPVEPTDHAHAYGVDQLCEICGWAYPENLYYFRFIGTGDGYYNIVSYSGNTETVIIPQKYGGKPVRGIERNAFENRSNIQNLVFPDTVQSFGDRAFAGCTALQTVTIPANVSNIASTAFQGCTGLKSVVFEDGVKAIDGFMDCTNLESVSIPEGATSIGSNAFQNCTSLSSIRIPDSMTTIGAKAFDGCTKLIETENGISYAAGWAVLCDTSITDAVLREGTVGIAACTFMESTALQSITIPVSVKTITMYASYSCPSLSKIYYRGTEAQWGEINISSTNSNLLGATLIFHA